MPAPTILRHLPVSDPRLIFEDRFAQILDTRRWTVGNTTGLLAVGQGKAANFNGSSQWLSRAGDDAQFSTGDVNFAVAAWVYVNSLPGASAQFIFIEKWATAAGAREWTLLIDNTGGVYTFRFYVRMADDSAFVIANATTFGTPTVRTWYLLYGYHDATNDIVSISVNNGTADTSAIVGGVQDTTSPLSVGRRGNPASMYLPGRIGPWGFWKTTLPTAAVLTELYNSGNGRLYADLSADAKVGLVEWYDLQEESGDRAGSVAGLTLTNNGTTLWGHGPTRSGVAGAVFSGGLSGVGDPAATRSRAIRRRPGLALEGKIRPKQTDLWGPHMAFVTTLPPTVDTQVEHAIYPSASLPFSVARGATGFVVPYSYSGEADYWAMIVQDSAGAHFYLSTDRVNWTLVFVDTTGSTASLYAAIYSYTGRGTISRVRAYRRSVKAALTNVAGPFGVTTAVGGTLVTNGNMESDNPPSSWTAIDGSVLSAVADDAGGGVQCLSQTKAAGAAVSRQAVTHANRVWVRLVGWVKKVSTGGRLRYYSSAFALLIDKVQSTAAWTRILATARATAADGYVYLTNDGGAGSEERYDNIDLYAITLATLYGTTAYTTPASNASVRFKVPTCTNGTQAGMAIKRVDDSNCILCYWNRNDGKFYIDQVLAGAYTNLASATLAYSATAEAQAVWNGADLRVHVGSTAIGAGLTIHANLLAATDARVWATDDDSRVGPITIEGGLP